MSMKTLLLAEGMLKPCCSKSQISYSFNVKSGAERFNIFFDFNPKKLDNKELSKKIILECMDKYASGERKVSEEEWEDYLPVKNLLTISIDDNKEFRGAAHRQPDGSIFFIDKESVSPGLVAGELRAGQWTVTISVHCVVTDICSYKLHIWTGED